MSWRAASSLLTLQQQLKGQAPRARPRPEGEVDPNAWGLIGDAAHEPDSDHTPHNFPGLGAQVVTAADFPNRPDLGLDAHRVLDNIRLSHDPRVKYGISNGQMFSSYAAHGYAAWVWRPYDGDDKHRDHGHLSVVGDARADGTQPWATGGSGMAGEFADQALKTLDGSNALGVVYTRLSGGDSNEVLPYSLRKLAGQLTAVGSQASSNGGGISQILSKLNAIEARLDALENVQQQPSVLGDVAVSGTLHIGPSQA